MTIPETPARKSVRFLASLLIVSALVAFVLGVRRFAREPLQERGRPVPGTPGSGALAFASNADCRPCHEEIWDEWAEDQHALAWFNEPLLPQDPKRTECNNCHAPEPILETGLDTLAVIRTARFEEGVGCIECHRNGEHVEGPLPGRAAACDPRENAVFTTPSVCAPCHAQHGSLDEWQASEWSRKGFTCQACHMPLVERASASGGPPRSVRSHRMRSQRDPSLLREAVALEARLDERRIAVSLANVGAGHNVPGEIFNRELVLATRVLDPAGGELAAWRESLKTVKREQRSSEPSTQLRSGETRAWSYSLPAGHGTVEVRVLYKSFYLMPDAAAQEVHARTLQF